ncbi:MAG: IS110 family transposase [Thermoproteota archaeon]
MSTYIGLDVHKDWSFATVLDQTGRVVVQKRLENEHVPSFLENFNVLEIGLEASTHVAPLYRALVGKGFAVEVCHPKKTRYIAEARIKSDRVDSKAIAELVRLDALPKSYMPPPEIAGLRERVRRRAFLVRERAKLMTKIRGLLAYEGVRPPEDFNLFTRKGFDWLRSLGLEPVDCYLRVMEVFNGEIRRLSFELRHMACGDEDVKLLMTIPGLGYYLALLVKAEIGDVNRFKSGDHLCSYAGLVPSTRSSGGVTKRGGITREGSRWLRWAMVEATITHVKCDTAISRSYHRIAERRGRKAALVAIARRLLLSCYRVLKSRRPYEAFPSWSGVYESP